jgi:hypothetical protein
MIVRDILIPIYSSNNRQMYCLFTGLMKLVHFVDKDGHLYAYEIPPFMGVFPLPEGMFYLI